MAFATSSVLSSKQSLAGASVSRNAPFTSARAAPRSLVVLAQQGPNDAALKTIGALAAAQIALLPLSGAAVADVMPDQFSIGALGANPAEAFANKSKAVVNKAKAGVLPDSLDSLASKTKAVAEDAKASLANTGVSSDPLKGLQNKAKSVTKGSNPAAEYAQKQAEKAKSAVKQAAPKAQKAVNKAKVANPARDFALKAEQAKNKVKSSLPLAAIGFNTADLQKEVFFGFGEAKSKVNEVKSKVEEATPNDFSIFNADSVKDAKSKLKDNVQQAVNSKQDPAERVASIGKPGESQEENAERIRREAENGAPPMGDARAPTN